MLKRINSLKETNKCKIAPKASLMPPILLYAFLQVWHGMVWIRLTSGELLKASSRSLPGGIYGRTKLRPFKRGVKAFSALSAGAQKGLVWPDPLSLGSWASVRSLAKREFLFSLILLFLPCLLLPRLSSSSLVLHFLKERLIRRRKALLSRCIQFR